MVPLSLSVVQLILAAPPAETIRQALPWIRSIAPSVVVEGMISPS
ncbi:MAG: hypothetical protein ABI980_11610 [Nitrospirota bacterium]